MAHHADPSRERARQAHHRQWARRARVAAALLLTIVAVGCTRVYPTHVATLDPSSGGSAQGSATARLLIDRLVVEGVYRDLSGTPTSGSVLDGAEVTAPVILGLEFDGDASGEFAGSGVLGATQLDRLAAGEIWIRVYTDAHPEGTAGEIHGNLRAR